MDPNTRALMMGAAGAGGGEKIYVEDVFSTWLYTGNGSTQTITNGIDLAGKGGLVWIKNRNGTSFGNVNHCLHDSARGVTQSLASNNTSQQFDQTTGGVTAFNASGFSLGSYAVNNDNGYTYASWTFRKAPKFFDVVTWTGDGTANRPISHSLGSVPGCIIVKQTSNNGGNFYTPNWFVWHRSYSNYYNYQQLNTTDAVIGSGGSYPWGSLPTSTTFGVQNAAESNGRTNATGETYVAYVFAHDAGGFGDTGNDSVIKCGLFSGTGFVNLGWEPQWIMIKPYNQTYNWEIYDNMRGMGQPAGASSGQALRPNTSGAESGGSGISFEATGFTQTTFGGSYPCIYIAIRRGPMKTPTDATKVFAVSTTTRTTNFVVDAVLNAARPTSQAWSPIFASRLSGGYMTTSNTDAQANYSSGWDSNTEQTGFNYSDRMLASFRRAPGFFDVVAYTGTGSATTVSHNLGVAPELMIVKWRTGATGGYWPVYASSLGSGYAVYLNISDQAYAAGPTLWDSTAPTISVFTVGTSSLSSNNSGGTYIAYLFASCPGVSKVGSYTGTGTTLQINCGFTAGARFVMIKRTDSTGDWYTWDTARGIISGNDPYLLMNSAVAEVTNTDYIDPLSSGFEISSSAPAAINASGGSFIYLAIA